MLFVGKLGLMQWLEPKKYLIEILIDSPSQRYLDQAYQDKLFKKCMVVVVEGEKVITAMLRFQYRATSVAMNTDSSHKDALDVLVHRFLSLVFLL